MKCFNCKGKTIQKIVEHMEFGVLVGKYRAEVCSTCGEIFYDERTVEEIQVKSKQLGLFGLSKKVKIAEIGNSIAIRVPKKLAHFLALKKGKEVTLFPKDKHDLIVQV